MGMGGVAQVVKCLLGTHEALGSNPSNAKKNKMYTLMISVEKGNQSKMPADISSDWKTELEGGTDYKKDEEVLAGDKIVHHLHCSYGFKAVCEC
jgi:hypothetical protein